MATALNELVKFVIARPTRRRAVSILVMAGIPFALTVYIGLQVTTKCLDNEVASLGRRVS